MSTADIKQKLLTIASDITAAIQANHIIGDGFDSDYGIAAAIIESPKQLKRVSKRKLSDATELRVFTHPEAEDEYLAVVEHQSGRLELSIHDDLELIPVMFKARLPSEYAFCIIKHATGFTIPIAPVWALAEDADPDEAYSARELESVWNTCWFEALFNEHLQTSMEGIFAPKFDDVNGLDILTFMESAGLVYSSSMELEELRECDLPDEAGGSYIQREVGTSLEM